METLREADEEGAEVTLEPDESALEDHVDLSWLTPARIMRIVDVAVLVLVVGFILGQLGLGNILTNNTPAGGDMGAHVYWPWFLEHNWFTKGRLSVYSEMRVRNGRVDGYVKPLFADMDVYDVEQDSGKNIFQQLKEALVGAGSVVLENRTRSEVATVASLSGPVENPNASTLDVVLGLLRNAFIKAILPGLEPHRR